MNDTTPHDADVSVSWMKPILDYLINDVLPYEREEARRVRSKVSRYVIIQECCSKVCQRTNGTKSYKTSMRELTKNTPVEVASPTER